MPFIYKKTTIKIMKPEKAYLMLLIFPVNQEMSIGFPRKKHVDCKGLSKNSRNHANKFDHNCANTYIV